MVCFVCSHGSFFKKMNILEEVWLATSSDESQLAASSTIQQAWRVKTTDIIPEGEGSLVAGGWIGAVGLNCLLLLRENPE